MDEERYDEIQPVDLKKTMETNYIEYSIGTQKSTAEILTSDVAIYVKSSARVDATDANGVDVSVQNTTTLPVYFKVVDDDATSPRFKLVGRSGVVKQY